MRHAEKGFSSLCIVSAIDAVFGRVMVSMTTLSRSLTHSRVCQRKGKACLFLGFLKNYLSSKSSNRRLTAVLFDQKRGKREDD